MPEKRTASLLLYDISQAIEKIETFCARLSLEHSWRIKEHRMPSSAISR